jgi:hypothetical protein
MSAHSKLELFQIPGRTNQFPISRSLYTVADMKTAQEYLSTSPDTNIDLDFID